jgi:hypothetical protein
VRISECRRQGSRCWRGLHRNTSRPAGRHSASAMFTQSHRHIASRANDGNAAWRRPRILLRFVHELGLAAILDRPDMRRRSNGARPGPNSNYSLSSGCRSTRGGTGSSGSTRRACRAARCPLSPMCSRIRSTRAHAADLSAREARC